MAANIEAKIELGRATTLPAVVIDDFLPIDLARAMRADIEAHFANPSVHAPPTHQVWNYWHVPGLYTYLRTAPEKVIQRDAVEKFAAALRTFSLRNLGLGGVTWPYLSLYVPGCRQHLHNDSKNGRFGYVFSLTKNERKTIGGDTIVMREGDLFRENVAKANAGPGFQASIEPKFNRLILFDDRMPHAVERVDGAMDPVEGRFVLHGHIGDDGPHVAGALKLEQVQPALVEALTAFLDENYAHVRLYHGPFAFRLEVAPDGKVATVTVLLDRVAGVDRGDIEWPRLRAKMLGRFAALRFPAADGPTVIAQPLVFEASLYRPKL